MSFLCCCCRREVKENEPPANKDAGNAEEMEIARSSSMTNISQRQNSLDEFDIRGAMRTNKDRSRSSSFSSVICESEVLESLVYMQPNGTVGVTKTIKCTTTTVQNIAPLILASRLAMFTDSGTPEEAQTAETVNPSTPGTETKANIRYAKNESAMQGNVRDIGAATSGPPGNARTTNGAATVTASRPGNATASNGAATVTASRPPRNATASNGAAAVTAPRPPGNANAKTTNGAAIVAAATAASAAQRAKAAAAATNQARSNAAPAKAAC